MSNSAVVLTPTAPASTLLAAERREYLSAWFNLYLGLEAAAGSDNTFLAKKRDLQLFLQFFQEATHGEHPDGWTRSVTTAFLKRLSQGEKPRKPTTINRILATLRHAAAWIHKQRPFLAGNPCERIADLTLDDPAWRGLSELEIMRLRSAAEQLTRLKTARNQHPLRDQALFLALLQTGMRISELLSLDLWQYQGKHFCDVRRKGKKVSAKVFVAQEAREVLDRYLDEVRGRNAGPLFLSRSGRRLLRQNAHNALKALANHANAQLPADQKTHLSAHILRHTLLRKAADKHGVHYALELSAHTSSQYVWRYVRPSDEQKEKALEELF
jgi:integrase/recombinase XerD